jgi:hypothetical protein
MPIDLQIRMLLDLGAALPPLHTLIGCGRRGWRRR